MSLGDTPDVFPKPQVAASIPAGGAIHAELSLLAQTSKQEVDGSS